MATVPGPDRSGPLAAWVIPVLLMTSLLAAAPPAAADHVDDDEIRRQLPPDAIPAITDPTFTKESHLDDGERVLGVVVDGDARAYPIKVMNYHEIVDDIVGETPVAVSYCPLCRTGLVFDRRVDGETLTFKVSGALLRNNLLMYDTKSGPTSLWAQAWGQAVKGPMHGTELDLLSSTLTTWGEWRDAHPNTLLMEIPERYDRDYDRDPYAGYDATPATLMPPAFEAPEVLHPKALVLGLASGDGGIAPGADPVAWSFELLEAERVVHGEVGDTSVVATFARDSMQAFRADGRTFEPRGGGRMADGEGNVYDRFTGEVVEGDGSDLRKLPADVPFWFSWFDFHPDTGLWHTDGFHTFGDPTPSGQGFKLDRFTRGALVVLGAVAAVGLGGWIWRNEREG